MTAQYRAWQLPLVFLLGYLFAWGTIQVDRHMLIQEQQALRQELRRTRQQLRVIGATEEFGSQWQEIVTWNKEAIKPPKEVGK